MDTDVEVLSSLDSFLDHHAFSGFEDEHLIPTGIMASEKEGKWAKDNLDYYNGRHFVKEDGTLDQTTNVTIITNYMLPKGLKQNNTYQDFPNLITIYPKDYFCPKSKEDAKIYLTNNTVTIHHFAASWTSPTHRLLRKMVIFIGGSKLKNFLSSVNRRFFHL